MDGSADRAVFVRVTDRLLLLRVGGYGICARDRKPVRGVPETAQVDVAERQDDLQRQREQPEARANP